VSGFDGLIHAIPNMRALLPATRSAWQALLEHYVFGPPAAVTEHIPTIRHGILGQISPADEVRLQEYLAKRLKP
jgi:hypothetical protein